MLVCLMMALGFGRYWVQDVLVVQPPEAYAGQTREITACLTEYPIDRGSYTSVYVRLMDEEMPDCDAVFYVYDLEVPDLKPGDIIQGEVKFSSASLRMGEETDTYLSKGVYLRGYFQSDVEHIGRWKWSFLYGPKYVAKTLQDACDSLLPERTALFLKALTTGEKSGVYLDPELYVALSTSGIMHVIAVSGMHVAFLVSAVSTLFGNRRGIWVSILAIVFFSFMTGGSPSVARSAFIHIIYLLGPVFRREPDGITSLSFALFVLLLINPCSAGSISLQLSFASMSGILLVTPRAYAWFTAWSNRWTGIGGRISRFVGTSLSATIGATVFSTPLIAIHFGNVAIYSALTNLLTLWIVPVCFIGGFLGSVVGIIWPWLGKIIGLALSIPVEFIYAVAGLISKLPGSAIYLSGNFAGWWMVFVYGFFAVSYLKKREKPYRSILPICISISSLCILMGGMTLAYQQGTTVTAVDVGQGQSIVILDDKDTVVVDCGGDYIGDAGDATAAYLLGRGRADIDLLVLTHLHDDHINGVSRLMARMPVHRIVTLAPEEESESISKLLEMAQDYETELLYIDTAQNIILGDLDLTLYVSPYKGENRGILVQATVDDYDVLITGDVGESAEHWLLRNEALPDGELIVVGHHGAKDSTGAALLDAFAPETALISVGYNSYGHPSEEVLDRLEERNVVLYRTDQLGNAEIRIGEHGKERDS